MIYEIRRKQVMLDSDLARLYKCKNEINQAVVHRLLAIPRGGHLVDFFGNVAQDDESVDAEREEGEKNELGKSAVGS